jgi:hypothetical protein
MELDDLEAIISRDLASCTASQRELFEKVRISPSRWRLRPWGDRDGGFWAVAVHGDRVLWYNDIEEGFNVSEFNVHGEIPGQEYWCNQDQLSWALPRLAGDLGPRLGPPRPLHNVR